MENYNLTMDEAIIKALLELNNPTGSKEIYEYIKEKGFYKFSEKAKTPENTISSLLSGYIRHNDSRISKMKNDNGQNLYCLSTNIREYSDANQKMATENNVAESKKNKQIELALHKILSSYLKNKNIYSKTIKHTISKKDGQNNIWIHPDIVGIEFVKLKDIEAQNFFKSLNLVDTFKISSYEMKIEIKNGRDLKEAFFQAVCNSSWANYGYLVARYFDDFLKPEMERLSEYFGIGFIQLGFNPYESRVLLSSRYKSLDFKMIDKLSEANTDFSTFIKSVKEILKVENNELILGGFEQFCDDYFPLITSNDVFKTYFDEHKIPYDRDEVENECE